MGNIELILKLLFEILVGTVKARGIWMSIMASYEPEAVNFGFGVSVIYIKGTTYSNKK